MPQVAPGVVVHVGRGKRVHSAGVIRTSVGDVSVNGRIMSLPELGAAIREELARRVQNTVYLSADDENSWGDVVGVMDLILSETGCRVVLLQREHSLSVNYPE
jgi:biopolymer transport protein ExbD